MGGDQDTGRLALTANKACSGLAGERALSVVAWASHSSATHHFRQEEDSNAIWFWLALASNIIAWSIILSLFSRRKCLAQQRTEVLAVIHSSREQLRPLE